MIPTLRIDVRAGRAAIGQVASLRPRLTIGPLRHELVCVPRLLERVLRRSESPWPASTQPPNVLLIPGFLSGDWSLSELATALALAGHRPASTGMRINVDCSEAALERLEVCVEAAVAARSAPVALVGHSRGGLFARVLAARRPDLVDSVVTLGAPHRDQLAIHPAIWASAWSIVALGRLGMRGLLSYGCAAGACCATFRRDLAAPLDPGIRFVSIYSRSDGLVDWRACLDPAARHIEIATSHLAMTTAPEAVAAVCEALAQPAALLPHIHARSVGASYAGLRPQPARLEEAA
jgi:pimeloyl-ACP methyl ester carboxylesterase